MQGPIAQALALSCVGNAFLRGENVSRFWPQASVFRFTKSCDFREIDGDGDRLIAADPLAWFETLRASRGLRLYTGPRSARPKQTIAISERESAGFVGGGPAWIIEVVNAQQSKLWVGHDRLGDRGDQERKIWQSTYLLSQQSGRETHPQMRVQEVSRRLKEALFEIECLARIVAPAWREVFTSAGEILNDNQPDPGAYADIADYARFNLAQRQILGAVSAGWVFGGMGSWNDVIAPKARAAEYERVSEELFGALIDAICALANSTFNA